VGRVTNFPLKRRNTQDRAAQSPRNERPAGVDYGGLPQSSGYMLRRAQLAAFQHFMRAFAEVDIRPAQFAVLTIIEHNSGLKQSQVSAALGIKRTNLVALLDALEERGLAKRAPVAADRRSYALHLTEAGDALMKRLREIDAAHEAHLIAAIGEQGRDKLLELLRGILQAAGPASVDDDES
jgi:DNA-binding MarR family transcriptional regulator